MYCVLLRDAKARSIPIINSSLYMCDNKYIAIKIVNWQY